MMDDQRIRILETTFAEFSRGRQEAATLFYERLFALDPSLRRLFAHVDMKAQQAKLIAALGLVIASLPDLPKVVPVLEGLAVRHVGYGIEETHYRTVGTALLQALALTLGNRFTPDVRAAWSDAYAIVSEVMIAAARRATVPAAAAE